MFMWGFLFGLLSGVLLLLLFVVIFVFNIFGNKRTSKEHNAFQPMSPQKTRIPNELKAFLRSCSDGDGSEWESCSSLSLLLHFLFQEHKDTRHFRRWFYKKLQLELNDVTARSSTAGRIIQGIQIRDLEAGTNSPMVNNVRVESFQLSEDDPDLFEELVLLLDVDYRGGFQMSVDAFMAFGKFAQLSVKLIQLNGRARFSIRRQPFAHWSFSFVEAPQLELKFDSQFQGRNLRHLIPLIGSAFRKALQLKHVWPNYKLRFRPFFQNPLFCPSPNMAAFEHVELTGAGLEVTVLSSSRLNLSQLNTSVGRLFCKVVIEKRPFNPYQMNAKNFSSERLRKSAHLLSVLLQFSRKGTSDPLALAFETHNKNGREVRVAGVESGSNAEKCGFRVNDTLVAVNNIPVRNERQATRLLMGTAGDLVVLVERELNENANEIAVPESPTISTKLPSNENDFIFQPNTQPIEFSGKDELDGEVNLSAFGERKELPLDDALGPTYSSKDNAEKSRNNKIPTRKLSISSERAARIIRNKKIRRSRSESEIRINRVKSSAPRAEENLVSKIFAQTGESSAQNSGIVKGEEKTSEREENGTEREPKHGISRREKLHAKANVMAERLSKSRLNEFIWSRRKPVEMAVEAQDGVETTTYTNGTAEKHRVEKPRRKWTRKRSSSPSTGEKQKVPISEQSAEMGCSKCTKSVQMTRNPIWGQSLHFGLNKESLYMNVLLYVTKNADERHENDAEQSMLGWTSVYVPRIVEDCTLTLSNCHREKFHLREPKGDCSVSAEFEELSRHNGFDRRLCFGDLLIGFRFFPDGLPAELGACSTVQSPVDCDGTSAQSVQQREVNSCQSLPVASAPFEHRWIPLKHKQSFNLLCGICGGKIWLKWAHQCEKCELVCHAKCLERAQTKECQSTDDASSAFSFNDDTFIEFDINEIPDRKVSDTSAGEEPCASSTGQSSDAKSASSNCRRRRIAEKLQTFSALTLKSVQEYSRRRKGQATEKENSASDFGDSPDSPKSPFPFETERPGAMVSIAEVLELDLLNTLEGFGPNSQFSDLKFEPDNAYNPQVVCEAKVKGQHLFEWCSPEERKRRVNAQIDRVQAEIETMTRLRRSLPNKSGVEFERSEHRLQALAFIMMLYCYALNDCHEKEEEQTQKSKATTKLDNA